MRIFLYSILMIIILVSCSVNKTVVVQEQNTEAGIFDYGMAEMAYTEGKFEDAYNSFLAMEKSDPTSIYLKQRIIETLSRLVQAKPELNIELQRRAEEYLKKDPNNLVVLQILADYYSSTTKPGRLSKIYDQIIKLEPTGINYFKYFYTKARATGLIDTLLLDRSYERSSGNQLLALSIGQMYAEINPSKARKILIETDTLYKSNETFNALLEFYRKNKEVENLNQAINSRFSNKLELSDLQRFFLIESNYVLKKYEDTIADSLIFLSSNDVSTQKYLYLTAKTVNNVSLQIKALEYLNSNYENEKEKSSLNFALVMLYFQVNELKKCVEILSQIKDPGFINAFFLNDVVTGTFEKFQILVKEYEPYYKHKYEGDFLKIQCYLNLKDNASASSILDKIKYQEIESDSLLESVAYFYLIAGNQSAKARKVLDQRKSKEFSTPCLIGLFYAYSNQDSLAVEFLEEDIKNTDLPSYGTFQALCGIFDKRKDLTNEISYLRNAIDHYPDSSEFLNWLGYLLVDNTMDLDFAETLIAKALEISPDDENFWDSRAWLYYKKKDFKMALKSMKLPMEKGIKSSVVSYHIGEIYFNLKNMKEAKKFFTKAIELNNDTQAVNLSKQILENYLKE